MKLHMMKAVANIQLYKSGSHVKRPFARSAHWSFLGTMNLGAVSFGNVFSVLFVVCN